MKKCACIRSFISKAKRPISSNVPAGDEHELSSIIAEFIGPRKHSYILFDIPCYFKPPSVPAPDTAALHPNTGLKVLTRRRGKSKKKMLLNN